VSRFGSADICVTNAGGPPAKGFLATNHDNWRKALDQNFLSTVYFTQEVIPHMQAKRWGRIITITSITTKQPVPDLVLSNAVRAAVLGLVKSLANEFGKDGILVNNVAPGYTATYRLKELAKNRSAATHKSEKESMTLGRWIPPLSASVSPQKLPMPLCGSRPKERRSSPDRQSWSMVERTRVSRRFCQRKVYCHARVLFSTLSRFNLVRGPCT
jgi:3-oxoacyl-[acyl-carrier protein] reductase